MKKCKTCQETKEHYANGLCESCYNKLRYKTDQNVRNYYKSKTYEWRKKNPERWKEIMRKAGRKCYRKKRNEALKNE